MFSQFQALVLGAVQGLTEFLPVSSSAHLALLPWLAGWEDPGLAFDVALHMGTLVALLIFYWREWFAIVASVFGGDPKERRLLGLLIVGSIPGAIFGFLFEKQAETTFRSPALIAIALAVMGIVLWIVDLRSPNRRRIGEITVLEAFLIGLSQAFAIVPGVSRSGVTITAARALGLRREDAANFSFLMAAPIIAGAGLLKLKDMTHGQPHTIWTGLVVAAIFGVLAIAALLRFVRSRSYAPFAIYRIAVAAAVLAIFLRR